MGEGGGGGARVRGAKRRRTSKWEKFSLRRASGWLLAASAEGKQRKYRQRDFLSGGWAGRSWVFLLSNDGGSRRGGLAWDYGARGAKGASIPISICTCRVCAWPPPSLP
jgi:hypothetical protein